jgi:hypothetical protein
MKKFLPFVTDQTAEYELLYKIYQADKSNEGSLILYGKVFLAIKKYGITSVRDYLSTLRALSLIESYEEIANHYIIKLFQLDRFNEFASYNSVIENYISEEATLTPTRTLNILFIYLLLQDSKNPIQLFNTDLNNILTTDISLLLDTDTVFDNLPNYITLADKADQALVVENKEELQEKIIDIVIQQQQSIHKTYQFIAAETQPKSND